MEYEAFILNEKCHYTGAFCSSFHCDELAHLCKVSYKLGKINEEVKDFNEVDKKIKLYYSEDIEEYKDYDLLGSTGCGLCSLKKLKEAGVTHLKVVGRGNSIDFMERDVKELRTALDILEKISNGNYEEEMKNKLFKNKKCSRNCYY